MLTHRLLRVLLLAGVLGSVAGLAPAAEAVSELRLYTLDCGSIDFKDLSAFSDTGEYDGKSGSIVVSCYVIRHPKGTLLWDTGLADALATQPVPSGDTPVRMGVKRTLAAQLTALALKPADIKFVAFSHLHGDHTGNANTFTSSTWIINRTELAWAESKPTPFAVSPETFSAYQRVKTQMIDSDYDVFGDGTVRILQTPGHTPGHQVLMLRLKQAGVVLLTGDLYHMRADRTDHRVPLFNVDRAHTLASFDRIDRIARNTHARVIVQHDPEDFRSLPKFPAYLN